MTDLQRLDLTAWTAETTPSQVAAATSLLPAYRAAWEQALEQVMRPLDPGIARLRTLLQPWRLRADLLPWLGWGEDVPYWPEDESLQRGICWRSHALHGRIGTRAGFRELARFMGAEVRRIEGHPAKSFLGGWTPAARAAWLARQPQLRLYPRRARAAVTGHPLGHDWIGGTPPARTDALARATVRATLVHQGVETELTAIEWRLESGAGNATVTVARRGHSDGLHVGEPLPGWTAASDAAARLYSIDQRAYRYRVPVLLWRQTRPAFTPLATDVDVVAARAPRPGTCCVGDRPQYAYQGTRWALQRTGGGPTLGDCFTARSDTETRLYRRQYLHDPSVAADSRPASAYLGRTKLGVPPWQADLWLRLPRRRASSFCLGDGAGALAARDGAARIERTLRALDWMRVPHQRVLVDTQQHQAVRASRILYAGRATAGEINLRS
jgi:hypothetical protein